MNHEQLQGNWKQLQGKFREKWGKLTDDDLTESQGKAEILIGKITERYGIKKEEATQKLNQYLEKLDNSDNPIKAVAHDLSEVAHSVSDKACSMAKDYWQFAKDKPLATIGIAAAAGAVLSMLLTRRSK